MAATIVLDYSRQPTWALGVLCYEAVTGEHPFGAYPLTEGATQVAVPSMATDTLQEVGMLPAFITLLGCMLHNDPAVCLSLDEVDVALLGGLGGDGCMLSCPKPKEATALPGATDGSYCRPCLHPGAGVRVRSRRIRSSSMLP